MADIADVSNTSVGLSALWNYPGQSLGLMLGSDSAAAFFGNPEVMATVLGAGEVINAYGEGFIEGAGHGGQIVANAYTLGATDYLGVTNAGQLIAEGGTAYQVSRIAADISAGAAYAALGVKLSGTNVYIEGPKGTRLIQIRSVGSGRPVIRVDRGPVPGEGTRLHYHRPPNLSLHRPYDGGW
jgi:hypothetical protein